MVPNLYRGESRDRLVGRWDDIFFGKDRVWWGGYMIFPRPEVDGAFFSCGACCVD